MLKRLSDIIISLIVLIILSPVFLIVVYKVHKNLDSLVFFIQQRIGKNSYLFNMYKFYSISKVILDINNPWQSGLATRTSESTSFGKKLITTNKNVIEYPFYRL